MFTSEADLVERALPIFAEYYSIEEDDFIIKEPLGLFGVPDAMLYGECVISIEFKLKNWKRALKQAFRYKGFSNKSYVFLDAYYSKAAINSIEEFKHFNIGLCTLDDYKIKCYYEPYIEEPFSSDLAEKALSFFTQE